MKNLFLAVRKVLFWTHLVAGVTAGLVILVIALTGTILSFERQITDAANSFKIAVPADGRKLGAEELLAALKAAEPGTAPSAMTIRQEADEPVAFQFGREKTLFVDPYTGKVLGEGAKNTRAFFQFVTGLHRWLALQGDAHDVGQAITSAAALIFFFIILSGLYLWIPKRFTRKGLKVITTFQGGLKGRARDWNWHNVLGIWFAVPLLILSLTGVIMAYPWANKLLFAAVGEKPPERGGEGRPPGGGPNAGGDQKTAAAGESNSQGVEGDRPRGEGRRRREGGEGAPPAENGAQAQSSDVAKQEDGAAAAEGQRPSGEGRRRHRDAEGADAQPGDVAASENAAVGEGIEGDQRPRGEGRRRHREGSEGDFARREDGGAEDNAAGAPAEGGDRPRGEGRRRREGGEGAPAGDGGSMARREGGGGGGRGRGPQAPAVWPASTQGWNAAFAVAQGVSSGWQSIQFQMPRGTEATFAISDSHRARPDLRQSVTIDLATAAITKTEKFESKSLGTRMRQWVRWIHTGEAGGWPGQLLAGLSTLAALVLVWTGLALSWRRFFKKKAKASAKA